MLSVVYFNDYGRNIMVAAFLMRTDAEAFLKGCSLPDSYKIAEVNGEWQSWTNIKEGIN